MTNHEILNCYKLHKTLKKKGVSLNEVTRKNMSEQEKYQMFMEFKTYMDAKDSTNYNRIPCAPKVIQILLVQLFYFIQMVTPLWNLILIPGRNCLILLLILSMSLSTQNFQWIFLMVQRKRNLISFISMERWI